MITNIKKRRSFFKHPDGQRNMQKILREVIAKLEPDARAIQQEAKGTLQRLNAELKKRRLSATAIVGGSVAKGTFLSHDHDVDIFVQFPLTEQRPLTELLTPVVKAVFPKAQRLHGSRDYFRAEGKLNYEIVPVLKITKAAQAKNITDCSPLHVLWVRKFPKLRQQIMLTKAFCKASGVYGAESYIGGFSGHVVDILTIWTGGFIPLLRKSLKWKDREVIDYYRVHKGKALFRLNKSKLQSPIIVIDPTQPERNAAAALTEERLRKFQHAAAAFLKKPSAAAFERRAIDVAMLRKRYKGKKMLLLRMQPFPGKHDVIGAKMRKALEHISLQLQENDFKILEQDWHWQQTHDAVAWWVLPTKPLERQQQWIGPPVDKPEHVMAFRKRYPKAKRIGKKWVAIVPRAHVVPETLVRQMLKEPYIIERVQDTTLEVFE